LPSAADAPVTTPFDPADDTSFNTARSITVYDSLGAAHTASLHFVKTAANTWDMHVAIDGHALATQQISYSPSGRLLTPANGQFALPPYDAAAGLGTGAEAMQLTMDVSGTTQYGDAFTMTSVIDDGHTTGRLIGIDIDAGGVVQARFT